ncbi:hypothetical protein NQZ79_g146 [Umbelopsis isabellina]|nr:hypothetical protein NQZ79_g146 [Umbelopsis isabellina]
MSLSWLSFSSTQEKTETTPSAAEIPTSEPATDDFDSGRDANFESPATGRPKKATFTVESSSVTASADDSSFDDSSSVLSEAKRSLSLSVKAAPHTQKNGSPKPTEASKLSTSFASDAEIFKKPQDVQALSQQESLIDSHVLGVMNKDQVKAIASPRISPLMKPRERTNSGASSNSTNWIQRLNATKATAATHSTGISVTGDIQPHLSAKVASSLGDHDIDSQSMMTASPALSAIDRLTLQRSRSLDLRLESTRSSDEVSVPQDTKATQIGGGAGGGDNNSGDGDDDDDDKKPGKGIDSAKMTDAPAAIKEKQHEEKTIEQPSGTEQNQKTTPELTNAIWSWFSKGNGTAPHKGNDLSEPTESAQAVQTEPPEMTLDQQDALAKPSSSDVKLDKTPASTNNSPNSTITNSGTHNSSSWGFLFGNSTLDKQSHGASTHKAVTQVDFSKPDNDNKKADGASASDGGQAPLGKSVSEKDKQLELNPAKDEVTSLKRKSSITSVKSGTKSVIVSPRAGPIKTEEEKSRNPVIIERSSSQEKVNDTAGVTQTSDVNGGKSTSTKNVVLPSFNSQFKYTPTSEDLGNTTPTTLLNKALFAINGLFANKAQKNLETTETSSRIKGMTQKMANFIQDMKLEPETVANKRFVIVGVHGWFPMKLVRSMIGEPTGTSIKFCEQMEKGLKQYFYSTHGISIPDDSITIIPLEGEGKVEDRVQRLYDALLDSSLWLDAISSADVILWATHSQGTPVSSLLLKRLLQEGHIHMHRQQCCMLAMAGISQGPFPSLKGNLIVKYFEADAARELFEFMDSTSEISQKFRKSLASNLRLGIKMVLVGSMQDQVVPLYSAIMSSASHSNLFRAIYIDGHIYNEDDFLINLIIFALRLRNAGVSDHGLLIHISEVLAGNLYALEGGHSTIYEEVEVYTMAARYLFETAPFGKMTIAACRPPVPKATTVRPGRDIVKEGETYISPHAKQFPKEQNEEPEIEAFQARLRLNPFYLPWAMRGICDDARILNDKILNQELERLRSLFEKWNPISAKLREIKFRLEPLKARL